MAQCVMQEECERKAAADKLRYDQELATLQLRWGTLPAEYPESIVSAKKAAPPEKKPSQATSEKPRKQVKQKIAGESAITALKPRAKEKASKVLMSA
jgi:hypothetical protein